MNAPLSSSADATQFVSLVTRLGYLDPETADLCREESVTRGVNASQVALQRGALSPVQFEIVETLLRPTEAIPGYEILDLLGHGGMGAVFRARQKNLDRLVALKTVLVSQMPGPAAIARFEQEATTIGRLVHPHIVAAYDFGRHQGRLFLAMELVEGENAEDLLLRQGPLGEAIVWQLMRQAAAGLAHAAQHGIVHRDIKPANLMLVKPPAGFPLPPGVPLVKIADFGLAYLTTDANDRTRLTTANSTLGSPHYMAPEQLSSAPLDHRTDVYALGATAYHLLVGSPPFHGLTMAALVGQKLAGGPEPLGNLAPQLSQATLDLVAELMRREPAERPGDYETVMSRIDQVLAQHLAIAGAPTARVAITSVATAKAQFGSRLSGRMQFGNWLRSKSLWVAIVALALFAGLGGGWWHYQSRRTRPSMGLAPTGHVVELFRGDSLAGWRSQSGLWRDTTDEEGAPVIEGRNGIISRDIPDWQPDDPISGFRLSFSFRLKTSTAFELHFDLPLKESSASRQHVLVVNPAGAQLGEKSGEGKATRMIGKLKPWPRGAEGLHDVVLEKNGAYFVELDGEPIGSLQPERRPARPEFRLQVAGVSALFGDFTVESLGIRP